MEQKTPTLFFALTFVSSSAAMEQTLEKEDAGQVPIVQAPMALPPTPMHAFLRAELSQNITTQQVDQSSPRTQVAQLLNAYGLLMGELIKKVHMTGDFKNPQQLLEAAKNFHEYVGIRQLEKEIINLAAYSKVLVTLERPWRWHTHWSTRYFLLMGILSGLQREWVWFWQDYQKLQDQKAAHERLLRKNLQLTGLQLGDLTGICDMQEFVKSLDI